MNEIAPVVVFVHGAGGGGWEWGVWVRVFAAAGFRTASADLQPSAAGLPGTGLGDYREQVAGWLDGARAGGGQVVVAGASLGGLLALMNADRADAMVLVNPMPADGLPPEPASAPVRAWGRDATLAGTRAAMPDADDLAALHAFRRWRDESARVLAEARGGVALPAVRIPTLAFASDEDTDVPPARTVAQAGALGASLLRVPGSHVGPLLGRQAARCAVQAVEWLNAAGFRG